MAVSSNLLFLVNLAGSICLLLWGSYTVRAAVSTAYLSRIRGFLSASSGSRTMAFICGVSTATILQSSTAVVMLTTSFVTSGILSLGVAVVVILGADMGSALAARMLFLDLSFLPAFLLLVGLGFYRFSHTWRYKQLGRIAIGLGLMLLAIQLMKQVVAPITAVPISDEVLSMLESVLFIAMGVTAVLTWLSHSSVAVVLIIASMVEVGILTPYLSFSMLLGANIGSGMIALFLVSRRNIDSYSAALANFVMRSSLALVCYLFIDSVMYLVGQVGGIQSGTHVIYLHIAFNLLLSAMFIPFSQKVGDLARKILTARAPSKLDRKSQGPGSGLDLELVPKPAMAISCAKREAFRLADNTEALLRNAMLMFEAGDRSDITRLVERDNEINSRNQAIQRYLSEVRRHLPDDDKEKNNYENELDEILKFSSTMENVGDVVSHSLSRLALKRLHRGVTFSSEGYEELTSIHNEVLNLFRLEITRFASVDSVKPTTMEEQIALAMQLGQGSIARHRQRLSERKSSSISTSSIHQDTVRDLMQVVGLISNREMS